ncbi:MAG: hypothetical protein GKR91_05825 [Pseudomonadales bacterium]|nr:hypothetical protein [Pseudomonadales bacterium]
MPTIEYPQALAVPRKPTHLAFSIICSSVLVLCLSQSALAQDVAAVPLYGTADLEAGFLPDPHTVEVSPGGLTDASNLGGTCIGYIAGDQPDYGLNYTADAEQLGIFVESDVDTTLIVNDPRGNWHCNDDAAMLIDANPGIMFNTPISGNYNIWVGTYREDEASNSTTLVITEYAEEEWAALTVQNKAIESIAVVDGIDFGDNSSTWANDGECDDPRFEGNGMASETIAEDTRRDATDCLELYEDGSIRLIGGFIGGIDFGDDTSTWANDGECDDPRFEGVGMASSLVESDLFHDASDCISLYQAGTIQLLENADDQVEGNILRGTLAMGDETLDDDSFVDRYSFNGIAGGTAVVDLRSGNFDTFLIMRSPSGAEMSNDDYEDSFDRSLLTIDSLESGTYEVLVSSYSAGETGGYTLDIGTITAMPGTNAMDYSGSLSASDNELVDGEYYDNYVFEGAPGQRVVVDLRSDDFDTYLIVQSPNGETSENDDADGTNHSQVVMDLSELGVYEVYVTSYSSGETGSYDLNVDVSRDQLQMGSRDVVNMELGDSVNGSLQTGDTLSDDGQYQDSYIFDGDEGETVTIDMTSSDIDTYITLATPSGELIDNDDHNGSVDQSQIQLTLPESGRYRVIATSYGESEIGSYRLNLRSGSSGSISNTTLVSGEGQIYGVFAGIADYAGEDSDLPLTDQDAERARDALIEGAGMNPNNAYTLLNSDATIDNFRNALTNIAGSAGEDDTLVIFYSGHGGRVERAAGPDSRDPDGFDETMVLYDYDLLDDELANMLDQIDVGKVLLVMDACFSGGFSKDIVSVPGRMGLFSSEEDVLSQVALKFQAGGYLSVFFEEALTERYADVDENGELTAIELSQYLHNRFRADVKSSFGTDEYVRASGPQANYQQLVVDRGGIGPYNVLFRRQL